MTCKYLQVQWQRGVHRLPLVEAAYRGWWEIIKRIWERRLFSIKFSFAMNCPRPHAPLKWKFTPMEKVMTLSASLSY